jgi:two-component system OmpR family sensor kinase
MEARLRNRLLALLAAIWVLASAFTLGSLWRGTGAVLDSALQETAERLLLIPASAWASPDAAEAMDRFGDHHELVVYQVFADGRLLWRSQKAPRTPLAPVGVTGLVDAGAWRVYALGGAAGGPYVQVAEPKANRRDLVGAQFVGLSVALLVLLGLAALVVNWVLRRSFRDLEPARQQLARLGADGLRPIEGAAAPAELQPWVDTVNALLARLARLVDSERAFAADAAHELRTPLAAARAQLQRLQHAAGDDERAASAQAVTRQLDRMTRLCTRLLQLARIDAGTALRREVVDLVTLARLVVDEQRELRHASRIEIVQRAPAAALGDLDALGIALGNLVGNALQHAGDGARITVTIDGATVRVEDDGPGVDPARLPDLRRRFERGGSRRDLLGSGIGLALADRIACDSGGRLELQSPCANGRGFRATLQLQPAAVSALSPM